jgi:hypothetical protein
MKCPIFGGKYLDELPAWEAGAITILLASSPGFIAGFICMWLRSKGLI